MSNFEPPEICMDCDSILDSCQCTCPYCGNRDACECALFDAATGG